MYDGEGQARDLNNFALQLQGVLRKYGWELDQLDQLGVHKEVVRRLVWALQHPHIFLLLNRSELDQLITLLALSEADIELLRVAILTTSEYRNQLDRIKQVDEKPGSVRDLGAQRGEPGSEEDTALDRVLAPIYELIGKGRQAQHESYYSKTNVEQLKQARVAHNYFSAAVKQLDSLPGDIRRRPEWGSWQQIAMRDLDTTRQWLKQIDI